MERTWTPREVEEWVKRRDDYRAQKQLPTLAHLRENQPNDYRKTLERERKTLLSRLETLEVTSAWPVDKWPRTSWEAPFNGVLYLPHTYCQAHGFSKIHFVENQNLNFLVHTFYKEKVDIDHPGGNFVSQEGICNVRHEYLGPSPHVSGYQFNKATGAAEIEWYDTHLQCRWVGNRNWSIQAYYDKNVEGWVSKARGDCCRNYDWTNYLGLGE